MVKFKRNGRARALRSTKKPGTRVHAGLRVIQSSQSDLLCAAVAFFDDQADGKQLLDFAVCRCLKHVCELGELAVGHRSALLLQNGKDRVDSGTVPLPFSGLHIDDFCRRRAVSGRREQRTRQQQQTVEQARESDHAHDGVIGPPVGGLDGAERQACVAWAKSIVGHIDSGCLSSVEDEERAHPMRNGAHKCSDRGCYLSASIHEPLSWIGDLRVFERQITGDGIRVDIGDETFRDWTVEAIFNELLSKFLELSSS